MRVREARGERARTPSTASADLGPSRSSRSGASRPRRPPRRPTTPTRRSAPVALDQTEPSPRPLARVALRPLTPTQSPSLRRVLLACAADDLRCQSCVANRQTPRAARARRYPKGSDVSSVMNRCAIRCRVSASVAAAGSPRCGRPAPLRPALSLAEDQATGALATCGRSDPASCRSRVRASRGRRGPRSAGDWVTIHRTTCPRTDRGPLVGRAFTYPSSRRRPSHGRSPCAA